MTINLRGLADNRFNLSAKMIHFTCHETTFTSPYYASYRQGMIDAKCKANPASDAVSYRQGYLDSLILAS